MFGSTARGEATVLDYTAEQFADLMRTGEYQQALDYAVEDAQLEVEQKFEQG